MRSDEELMRAYVEGDAASFRALFDRYAPLLRGVFMRRLRTPEPAADLVQQTFLQLHRARHDFHAGALVRPWLMTIAFNLYREHYRRSARHPETALEHGGREPTVPPRGQQRADVRRDLGRALEALPGDQRDVVVLHWLDGLSFAEIAELLGVSAGAVRVRAHRAYAALRALLGESGNDLAPADVREDEP